MQQKLSRFKNILLLYLLGLSLFSCDAVPSKNAYDEVTYQSISKLQQQNTQFIAAIREQLGTEKAKYAYHQAFYDTMRIKLINLQIRANAFDNNVHLQEHLRALKQTLSSLETQHKAGFTNQASLDSTEQAFNRVCTAISKWQLQHKYDKQ